jgi:hypothetical protein
MLDCGQFGQQNIYVDQTNYNLGWMACRLRLKTETKTRELRLESIWIWEGGGKRVCCGEEIKA